MAALYYENSSCFIPAHLSAAFELIQTWPLAIFPLLRAVIIENDNETSLEWQNDGSLPWRFEFDCVAPAYIEQYEVQLHGTSFQQLLDASRRKKSVDLLLESRLNQEKIAECLGIRDPANFRRSFKRWTGFSPGEYLQAC